MRVFTAAFTDELVKVSGAQMMGDGGGPSFSSSTIREGKEVGREFAAHKAKARAKKLRAQDAAKAKSKADAKAARRAKWTSVGGPTEPRTSAKASSPPASIAAPKGKAAPAKRTRKPAAGGTWKPGDLRSKGQTQWKPGDLRPSASSPAQDAGARKAKPKRRGGGRQKLIRGPRPGSVEPIGGTMQGISGKQVARKPLVKAPARTQVAKPQSTGWRPGQPVTAKSLRASVPAGTGRTPPKLLPNRRPNRSYAMTTGSAPMRPAATAQYRPPKPAPAPTFGQTPSFGSAGQLKAPKMSPVATASAMPKAPKPPSFT